MTEDRESTVAGGGVWCQQRGHCQPPEKGRSEQGQEGSGKAGHEYLGRGLSGAKPLSKECAMQAERARVPGAGVEWARGKKSEKEHRSKRSRGAPGATAETLLTLAKG